VSDFGWVTPLGAAVALFAIVGAIHLLVGILSGLYFLFLPAGRGLGPSYVFVNVEPDRVLFGEPPAELLRRDAALALFRRIALLALAAVLTALGVVELAVTWFALREGEAWALGALAVSGLAMLPFYAGVFRPYVRAGAQIGLGDLPPFIWVPSATLIPATILGWIGLASG